MTTSVGPALPGFSSARAPSEQPAAGGKGTDTGFSNMLDGSGKQAQPERQPAAEPGQRDPRWNRHAPADRGSAEGKAETAPTDSRKISSAKLLLAKAAKDAADTAAGQDGDDTRTADQAADTSPLQDHLPLLMALHDLRHFSGSAKSDTAASSGGNPVSDPQAPLLKKLRSTAGTESNAIESKSRSERGSATTGSLAELNPQLPGGVKLPSGPMKHEDSLTSPLLPEGVADDAAPQAKLSSPAFRNVDEALSSLRPEAGKQASSANRAEVVSERSFPAPAQNPMSQAATAVVNAIGADDGLRQTLSAAPTTPQISASTAAPAHVLKIELHPAELGVVTASLRLAGEQLSIELKPESHEAYRRLTSDSEAIVKSLRGLGFDVDKVTILQPSIAVPAATRADASANPQAMSGRDPSSFQPGNSGGNDGGGAGQQSGRNRHDDQQDFGRPASPPRERAGSDMFI